MWPMRAATKRNCPLDFRLVLHYSFSESYAASRVLLARAGFDGSLQLLTCGWERVLGYRRDALRDKTLLQLMGADPRSAAAAVAAILDHGDMRPVDVRMRCRDGLAKGFRLHRHFDSQERTMYIVAEETAAPPEAVMREEERRVCQRRA